ncbi:MAG: HAD-IC family P-type ATPase, partial [Chthoniobacterales bacterium]|nr:HAD-IC family P-type ATPase [Chthoniobacterales bacterium]
CLDDGLVIRATSKGTERVLDRLMEEVRIAQSKAARLQREADRIVGWFLPMVVGIAVVTFVVWTWAVGWERGLFNALAVLVVACPCSMGLATPVGIWAALSSLARRGLIARDSDLVEMLGKVDVVVFDKTGTLGEERLDLVDFVVKEGAVRSQVLEEVAAIESKSSHPIALSFRRAHEAEAQRTWLLPGVGIAGVVGRVVLEVGNRGLLDGNMQTVADELRGKLRVGVRGTHEVWVKRDGELVGLGVLRERLREGAFLTIEAFEGMGIECVVMTGDRREFAEQHGFRVIHSELLPEEKAALVREYQKKGKKVLYIGDGINDGPAMATADVAVAVGENASILARETAQGILPSGDLLVLPAAVKTCVRTVRAIRGNLLYAAAYNIVGIALAAAGVIHPVVAALLMLLSSFGVSWRALAPAREEEDVKLQNLSNVDNSIRKSFLRFGFGLEKVRDLPALLRSGERMAVQLNGFELGLVVGGLVMQGVLLPWMGGFSVVSGGMLAIFFGVVAVMCLVFGRKREWGADAAMVGMMFSFGGLMMLLGWLADAGFLPVVRNGVCLCGCRDSGLGWGLLKPSWMMVGMAVSILPAVRFEPTGFVVGRLVCGVVSLLGMIVGMVTSAWLMAQIPVAPLHASAHFFATFSAMNLGMTFGMLLACRFLRMAFVKWRDVREETKR